MMTDEHLVQDLTARLSTIEDPEVSYGSYGYSAQADEALATSVRASILARFLDFIRDNADHLPSKDVVLAALEKAIDAALIASGRPILAGLLGPALKRQILGIAGDLYDRLLGVA